MPSTRATRRSPRCAAAPTSWCSRSLGHYATGVDRGAAAGRAAGHAAALGAALAARSAQHVPRRCTIRWRALPAEPMTGAQGRSARRLLRQRPLRLQQRPRAHAAAALRQPLAAGEEGSGGGAVRAGQADRLLDRPHHAGQVPRRHHRRRPRVEQGVREDRLQERRSRSQVQPDDADFDTLDVGRASIRWMTNASPAFGAIGPSHVDPRSGEILDADIAHREPVVAQHPHRRGPRCSTGAGVENPFGAQPLDARTSSDLLALRPLLQLRRRGRPSSWAMRSTCSRRAATSTPTAPRPQHFVRGYLKDMTMHEVGHTLGLRHNFRASRVYTDAAARRPGVHARRTASPAR